MSLKGSLEDFGLPEVLQLLADTSKTGKLQISGHSCANGSLWFNSGSIVAFEVSGSEQPSEAIFEMLRVGRGYFDFTADGVAPASAKVAAADHQDVRTEIERARDRLVEWEEIVSVVPSLDHRVHLVNNLEDDTIILDRDQWAIVAAIGGGQKVSRVLSDRYLGEFDGCKAIKSLVDGGMAAVMETGEASTLTEPAWSAPVVAAVPAPEPVVVAAVPLPESASSVAEPEASVPEPEPEAVAEPEVVSAAEAVDVPKPFAFGTPFGSTDPAPVADVSAPAFDDDYVYTPPAAEPAPATWGDSANQADEFATWTQPVDSAADFATDDSSYSESTVATTDDSSDGQTSESTWDQAPGAYTPSVDAGWTASEQTYSEPDDYTFSKPVSTWEQPEAESYSEPEDYTYVAPVTSEWDQPEPSAYSEPAVSTEPEGYSEPAVAGADQDQFADLRAAIAKAEIEELAVTGAQDGDAPATVTDYVPPAPAAEDDGRSALRALLAEVTSHVETDPVGAQADAGYVEPAYAEAGYADPGYADPGYADGGYSDPQPVAYTTPDNSQVDGLMDRGPWTSHELASLEQLDGWREDDGASELETPAEYAAPAEPVDNVVPFRAASAWPDEEQAAPVAESAAPAEAEAPAAPGEEPINRGLLLKFLSSVRN